MHGGMKTYTGSPAGARNYVEADRSRADDYYLAEGTGIAQRYAATGEGRVVELTPLTGDSYEAWVAGVDPDTGVAKGRLRNDDRAVRFVEVTVNGPKSWSLAAELHPDIAAAYDTAQDRAATQIIAWLSQHATTRVGGRGNQVQVPVEQLEAVTVRHYTSRAGDPHRHLHLQINARVFAGGQWRGLHTVGVRDSLNAINGIGHAAVATDPQFRAALAAHGFTVDSIGEIEQLAPYVGAFSQRAAQIGRNIDRYEAEWRASHPAQEPGPGLWRAWDARAWADGRPDKITPTPRVDIHHRWLGELSRLGYRDPDTLFDIPAASPSTRVGEVDRAQAVTHVLARLAAGRSAWNAADIRGEVEQFIAGAQIVVDAAVRAELAEDLTARALDRCVPLLQRDGVPEHIRSLTSRHVLDVEADIVGRLVLRGADPRHDTGRVPMAPPVLAGGRQLDASQAAAVAALAGSRSLVLIEGAAGAGKTTTMSTARDLLAKQGRRLTVVTPTLKAAKIAENEVGARAGSAAWLAFQHGWRWDDNGTWTRLAPGQVDQVRGRVFDAPEERASLRPGDLLIVDEAGMLDQDTARALLTIADDQHVRIALLGDRHQLSAVGRGGVLDLAARWAAPEACLTLDVVHRFTCETTTADGTTATVADVEYAALTAAMRAGEDCDDVFTALLARGQTHLHASEHERLAALADTVARQLAHGESVAVVVDTREQVTELNAAIRERLVTASLVDDGHALTTRVGERIGAGDRVATRRNDRDLDVANRDTWTVTHVGERGELVVTHPDIGVRVLPADYSARHVQLAYASTAHGVQGDTVTSAHLVLGEHSGAASAYVGMTRGREANTAHIVATDLDEAREQWVAVFARDRADFGPGHAAEQAAREAANYAQPRPLDDVLVDLHEAWDVEQRCLQRLARDEPRRDALREIAALRRDQPGELATCDTRLQQTRIDTQHANHRAELSGALIAREAERIRDALLHEWDSQRDTARDAAQVVRAGPGRLGLRLAAVNRATEHLAHWSVTWQPYLPAMPTSSVQIAHYANWADNTPRLWAAFDDYARQRAEHANPEHASLQAVAETAATAHSEAWRAYADTRRRHQDQLAQYGTLAHTSDPEEHLTRLHRDITTTEAELATAQQRLTTLFAEPALRAQPASRLSRERDTWQMSHDATRDAIGHVTKHGAGDRDAALQRMRETEHHAPHHASPDHDHGPSLGR
jgi:exodeoxyribonuclease V alpha subunit